MKHLATCFTALSLALAMPIASAAADPVYSKQFSTCMDKSGGVTLAMTDCTATEIKLQDTRLNANYKKLVASLSVERKTQLLDAQRSWLKFRDANCKFYFDPDGGSLARVEAVGCVLDATASRANELERLGH